MTTNSEQMSSSPGLPFDPVTIVIGLTKRWKILLISFILSVVLGVAAAYTLGNQTYEAETILLHKTAERKYEETGGRNPPVTSQVWMVKIPSNLRMVMDKLKLNVQLKTFADVFQVRVEKRTSLVFITAQWNSPEMAANLANTLRDVFIANQSLLIKADAQKEMKELDARFAKADPDYKEAREKLETFVRENKIVDIKKDVERSRDELTSLEQSVTTSENEKDTIGIQKKSLEERLELIKLKMSEEQSVTTQSKGLADLNIRIERLRRAIHDDKEQRKDTVELEKLRLAYSRAQELYDKGLIAEQDYQKARAEYEEQKVKAIDTGQIEEWKRQLKALEAEVIPEKQNFKTPSQELFDSLQRKIVEMELQDLALNKKLSHLSSQIARAKERLNNLTYVQRQYAELSKELSDKEAKRTEIEGLLTKVRKEYESGDPGFVVVSEARVPTQSIKSNRKIFFAAAVFLGVMLGCAVTLASVLLDTTIKSGAELNAKNFKPVLGVIPAMDQARDLVPDASESVLTETFRVISRHIRRDTPKTGARIMITSVGRGEGKTTITMNLAKRLAPMEKNVIVIDCQVRSLPGEPDGPGIIAQIDRPLKGLGEWLTFEVNHHEEIIFPTVLDGVKFIPRGEKELNPDLLGSVRMKELMETLSVSFGLILLDGPAVETYVDAELAAQWCDGLIFVVRGPACTSSTLRRAVERMGDADIPIKGFILNGVDRSYLRWT